jgi:hypothetical protein
MDYITLDVRTRLAASVNLSCTQSQAPRTSFGYSICGEGKPLRSDYMHIILYIVRASSCVHIPTRITDLKPQSVLHVIHFIVPSHHLVAMHS